MFQSLILPPSWVSLGSRYFCPHCFLIIIHLLISLVFFANSVLLSMFPQCFLSFVSLWQLSFFFFCLKFQFSRSFVVSDYSYSVSSVYILSWFYMSLLFFSQSFSAKHDFRSWLISVSVFNFFYSPTCDFWFSVPSILALVIFIIFSNRALSYSFVFIIYPFNFLYHSSVSFLF
jgi:hypothetical protein